MKTLKPLHLQQTSIKKNNILYFFGFQLLSVLAIAQESSYPQQASWSSNSFESKAFVENKGQFSLPDKIADSPILYGVDNEGIKIFFNSNGLTYSFDKTSKAEFPLASAGKARNKYEVEAKKLITRTYYLNMKWMNANENPEIIVEEKLSDHYNYGLENGYVHQAFGFKKLTYKNLYPNVDVEYTFHPLNGIKYNLILHPGADPKRIKMQYEGADGIEKDTHGNIVLQTVIGDFIDHAPVTFYADNETGLTSSFNLENNVVSFFIPGYDNTRELIIDPWTTNPLLASSNKAVEIGVDAAGSVYVYGSDNNFKVRKYSSLGVTQWTFDSGWSSGNWFGNLAVDSAGNSYFSNGLTNASIKKVSPLGVMLFNNSGTAGVMELFHLCFSKSQPNIIGLIGAQGPGACSVAPVSTTAGVVGGVVLVGTPGAWENRGLCSSVNGNYYTLTCNSGAPPNALIGFTNTFTTLFTVPTGLSNVLYDGPAYKSYGAIPGTQNTISASRCFVYTTDGATLKKYDATTGAFMASAAVAGGSAGNNSGIYADECDFVYVGTGTGVRKFDSGLTPVGFASTSGAVYDVDLNYATGEIVACGNNFVASLNLLSPGCPVTTCGAAIPINLLSFKSQAISNNKVKLTWITASELNSDKFIVERSRDGSVFEPIGTIKASGSSSIVKEYEFIDVQPFQKSYYRLKEVSMDNSFGFSAIVSADLTQRMEITLTPNPINAGNILQVNFSLQKSEHIIVKLSDIHGREVFNSSQTYEEGSDKILINTLGYKSGLYFLQVLSSDQLFSSKIVLK